MSTPMPYLPLKGLNGKRCLFIFFTVHNWSPQTKINLDVIENLYVWKFY